MKSYNMRQAAEAIGVRVRTLREWIRLGKIHGEKNPISGRWFFSSEEIDRIVGVYKK